MKECVIVAKDGTRLTLQKVSNIPYYEGLLELTEETEVHSNIEHGLLKPIIYYSNTQRWCHLLKYLSFNSSVAHLLSIMDFLAIRLDCRGINVLQDPLKNVHDQSAGLLRSGRIADRLSARDAAVEYCVGLSKELYSDKKLNSQIYNTTLFIASHPKTFSRRIRYHVVKESTPYLNPKQMSQINKWEWRRNPDWSDGNDMTEEEEHEEELLDDLYEQQYAKYLNSDSD